MKIIYYDDYRTAVNTANYHNYLYFVLGKPKIDDIAYDDLYFSIQSYEQQHPHLLLPDSPTQRVASDLHSLSHTIPHRTPMLSCQKCKTVEDVLKWMRTTGKKVQRLNGTHPEAVEYSIEWKYDGISCSLVYQDGELIEASTRGDHLFGQDILHHVRNIVNIPKRLQCGRRDDNERWVPLSTTDVSQNSSSSLRFDGRIEVRGEIIMPFAHLPLVKSYNDTRTAAASILNTDSPTPYDHLLQFRAWELIARDATGDASWLHLQDTYSSMSLTTLYDNLGFDIDEYDVVTMQTVEEAIEAYTEARRDNGFPTDGLVIKLEDKSVWPDMGATEHHPKSCIAYKFASVKAVTYCHAIDYTVGEKTGKLTPICFFAPVTIGGKTYEKCSLGSEAVMRRLGIEPGSKIEVSLRNDVLIQVDRVLND